MDKINSSGNYTPSIKNEPFAPKKSNVLNQKLIQEKQDCFISSEKPDKKTKADIIRSKAADFYNKFFKKETKEIAFCGNKKENENKTVIINLAPLYMAMAAIKANKESQNTPQKLPQIAEEFPDFYEALNETLENLNDEATFEDFINEITPYTPTMDIMGLIEEMRPALKNNLIEKYDNLVLQYIKENTSEEELESLGRKALADLIQHCIDTNEIHTMTLDELEQLANEDSEEDE